MPRHLYRAAGAGSLATMLLLTGCAGQELPEVDTGAAQPELSGPSAVGFMTSADAEQVVLTLPDGTEREFAVREGDVDRIGLGHLASHVGFTDIGFQVFYDSQDGTDFITGAVEVPPPSSR